MPTFFLEEWCDVCANQMGHYKVSEAKFNKTPGESHTYFQEYYPPEGEFSYDVNNIRVKVIYSRCSNCRGH